MRSRDAVLLSCAVGVLVVGPGTATAQTPVAPCDPAPKVAEAYRNLPASTGDAQADRTARLAAFRALLARFPSDVYLHQRYQDTAKYPTAADRDAVIAEYRVLAEKHPIDPRYRFLAARAQVGANTKQVLPDLEAIAAAVPRAHLTLIQIYQAPVFKDAKKAREHLEAFVTACPSSLAAYQYFDSVEPSDFLTQATSHLRTLLQARHDPESFTYWSTLWSLEFRAKPLAEHETLRKQVAADLTRLRAIDPGKNTTYYSTLREGYQLTGDSEGAKWVQAAMRTASPASASSSVRSEWSKEHPYPKPTDSAESRKAYNDAYAKATAEWSREWPDNVSVWFARVGALRNVVDQASAADVETAGERLLATIRRNPDQMSFISSFGGSSFALVVADLYAKKSVRVDCLPALVEEGLAELSKPSRPSVPSDLYPPSTYDDSSNRDYAEWYGNLTVADVWLNVKDKDRARAALGHVQALALKSKPKADLKDAAEAGKQRVKYLERMSAYWRRMGDLAQLEGRKADAVAFYQNALLAEDPSAAQKDTLSEKARALWKETGGTNEGWIAWSDRRDLFGPPSDTAARSSWSKIEKKLPAFQLTDLTGAKWELGALKGKITLINVWAST